MKKTNKQNKSPNCRIYPVVAAIASLQKRHVEHIHGDTVVSMEELAAIQIALPRIGLVWHMEKLRVADLIRHTSGINLR